jgi:hypothetical protein
VEKVPNTLLAFDSPKAEPLSMLIECVVAGQNASAMERLRRLIVISRETPTTSVHP